MMEKIQNSPSLMNQLTAQARPSNRSKAQAANESQPQATSSEAPDVSETAQPDGSSSSSQEDFSVSLSKSLEDEDGQALKVAKQKKASLAAEIDAASVTPLAGQVVAVQAAALKGSQKSEFETGQKTQTDSKAYGKASGSGEKIKPQQKLGLSDSAEQSPETFKSAASVNTAHSMTGLKPWDKNWVFEGADENPDLNPLFGAPEKPVATQSSAQVRGPNGVSGKPSKISGISGTSETSSKSGGATLAAAQTGDSKAVSASNDPALAGNTRASLEAALKQLGGEIEEIRLSSGGQQSVRSLPQGGAATPVQNYSGQEFLVARGSGQVQGPNQMLAPGLATAAAGQNALANQQGENQLQAESKSFWSGGAARSGNGRSNGISQNRSMSGADGLSEGSPGVFGREPAKKTLGQGSSMTFGPMAEQTGAQNGLMILDQQPRQHPFDLNKNLPTVQMSGQVTQGSMAKNRLSTETLVGMSGGIKSLTAQGGGEMQIRLKPDNLGELQIRVFTRGNEVGLRIHASDDKAKKIIEDSLGYLKDNMALQSLNLSKIEVQVMQAQPSLSQLANGGQESSRGDPQNLFSGQDGRGFDSREQSQHSGSQSSQSNLMGETAQGWNGRRGANQLADDNEGSEQSRGRSRGTQAMAGPGPGMIQRASSSYGSSPTQGQRLNVMA